MELAQKVILSQTILRWEVTRCCARNWGWSPLTGELPEVVRLAEECWEKLKARSGWSLELTYYGV